MRLRLEYGETQVEPKKWVDIEDAYTKKFGWDKGINNLLEVKRDTVGGKEIINLTLSEEYKLVHALRKFYKKEKNNGNNKKKSD